MADTIAESITDTDVEASPGNGQTKPEKTRKAPKPVTPIAQQAPQEAVIKKKKGGKIKIILIIIIILLIGGFVYVELTYNYFGTRDILIRSVMSLDEDLSQEEANLDSWEQELELLEAELDARVRSLDTREASLDRRGAELGILEQRLSEWEARLTPIYRRDMTEQELADMISLSRTFALMAPDTAAEILTELYDPRDIAAILYFMTERAAAPILSAMERTLAAEITEILLYE